LYSYKYGYGALDAYRYVIAAKTWNPVKPQAWMLTETVQLKDGRMSEKEYFGGEFIAKGGITSTITITKAMLDKDNFESLEHVNIKVWIDHARRGDVKVEITSPNQIKSILAGARSGDNSDEGFPGWTFMTVKHW
jgi:kexin